MANSRGNTARRFQIRKRPTEEDFIRRRAVIFGLLTVALLGVFIVWGFPLFVKVVGFVGDLKSKNDQEISKDTIPPLAPRLSYIPEATNSATLPISGVTEPEAKVVVSFNQENIETKADEEGKFLIKETLLNEGTNSLSLWAEDSSGNKSETTKSFEIIYDTESPELIIESPGNKVAVEQQTIEIKGKTEVNARVLVNDHVVILDEEGKFVEPVTLKEGSNEIKVVAQDKAGNETTTNLTVTYIL